jgi:Zn finger protein HypA/HybF involved in hydrogenase expression
VSDMPDKLIDEVARHAAFPPCRSCGSAMEIVLVTPRDVKTHEERMFKCPKCGGMESKIVEIK